MSSDASYSPPHTSSPPDSRANSTLPVIIKTPHERDAGPHTDDTYLTRPNRYFGPGSTWLSWTEQDRLVAQLLDQERAGNLGLHLVTARCLKRKAENEAARQGKRRKGKGRAADREEEGNGAVRVPGRWDAWPLGVGEVPRDDGFGGEDEGAGMYPSEKLEACLVATTTRLARERWREREWAAVESKEARSTMEGLLGIQKEDLKRTQNDEDVSDTAETLSSGSGSDSDTDTDHDDAMGLTTSQTYIVDEPDEKAQDAMGKGSKSPGRDEEEEDDPPTPIADDDQARALLLPGIRHSMSKLDDLLMALHKARQSYALSKRRGRAGSENSDTDEGGSRIPRSRSRSRSQVRKRARSISRGSETSVDSGKSDTSRDPKRQLDVRDWSDVLGMAAVIGWDPEIIQRASERCAKLFDENMIFRTFHEGSTRTNEPPYYEEHYAVQPAGEASGSEDDTESEGGPLMRLTAPCDTCSKKHRKCEPINAQTARGTCKACVEFDEECSGVGAKLISNRRRCPFRFCERHHIPFKRSTHLQRHLEAVHNEDRLPPSSSPARSSASEGYLGSDEPPKCPVESCPRHERPFSEGSKLYRHLRKMHPEVDVNEVKRLEVLRRGERRGRWGDPSRRREVSRRRRSKSFGVPSSPRNDPAREVIDVD